MEFDKETVPQESIPLQNLKGRAGSNSGLNSRISMDDETLPFNKGCQMSSKKLKVTVGLVVIFVIALAVIGSIFGLRKTVEISGCAKYNGDQCESCLDEYYLLKNGSCANCHCNLQGTKHRSTNCDSMGKCDCSKGYTGDDCSSCQNGYFKKDGSCTIDTTTIMIAGGIGGGSRKSTVEGIGRQCSLPNLPKSIDQSPSLVVTHDEKILLIGGYGNRKHCLNLLHKSWQKHSTLRQYRRYASAVTTPNATFVFGGWDSASTFEYLENGGNNWIQGSSSIPDGFRKGCAVSVSNQKFILVGGLNTKKRILEFFPESLLFKTSHEQLQVGRAAHACAKHKNQVLVTGGYDGDDNSLTSVEAIDLNTLQSVQIGSFQQARYGHGIGTAFIQGQQRLLAFGGYSHQSGRLSSIEEYNEEDGTWSTSNITISEAICNFGFATIPTKLICP